MTHGSPVFYLLPLDYIKGHTGQTAGEGQRSTAEAAHLLQLFRAGIERSGEVVFLTDPSGRIIYVNNRVTNILGYDPEEFGDLGFNFFERVHPEDLEVAEQFLRDIQSHHENGIIESEYRMKNAGGTWRWIHNQGVIFADDIEGGHTECLIAGKDITLQKESEERLTQDGTVLTWGGNYNGQLGDGTVANSSLPVQVGK